MEAISSQGALSRARLYHFFELALAHPAPDGLACFRASATEDGLNAALAGAGGSVEQAGQARTAAARFLATLRAMDDAQAEAAHIALFSVGFPALPCPPYGSLFTVEGDKRLDAMRRIKQVYERHGFDIDDGFTDLPDHLCVELEFMQALCFREHDAMADGDTRLAAQARDAQADFLDEFLQPFAERIAAAARAQPTANAYGDLLAATHAFVRLHRQQLDEPLAVAHQGCLP